LRAGWPFLERANAFVHTRQTTNCSVKEVSAVMALIKRVLGMRDGQLKGRYYPVYY
jgi:hypothetical protein